MTVAEKHHHGRIAACWQACKWPLLLFAIVSGFYWKITLTNQYTWLDGPDMAYQVMPWFQYQAVEWHRGHFPTWDPNVWGGQSLIGQAQPGVAYPLNWLLFLLPLNKGFLRLSFLHWYFVIVHFMGALFCYFLCRDLKRSQLASLLAGLAFSLGGWLGTTDWPQMMNGAVWAPLVFLFFFRAMRDGSGDPNAYPATTVREWLFPRAAPSAWFNAAASGACLGASLLSGHHQIPVFTGLAIGGVWIFHLFRDRRFHPDILKLAAVFGLLAFLIGGLQVLPAYEYGLTAYRWVSAKSPVDWKHPVPYYVHQEFALYMTSLPGIILAGIHRHANPFMGVTAVWLAVVALASGAHDRMVRLFATVAVGGLILSFGHNAVFHGVLYALVPMMEKARNSSFAIFIFCFGLAVLTSYGVDYFRSDKSRPWERVALWSLVGLSVFVLVLMLVLTLTHVSFDDRLGIAVPVSLLLAAIIRLRSIQAITPTSAAVWILGLVLLELGNISGYVFRHREEDNSFIARLSQHQDVAQFLRDQPGPVRVEVDDQEVPYNFGDWFGIHHFGGYLASMSTNVAQVQGLKKARRMFAVNYRVAKTPSSPDQQSLFEGSSGVKVFRMPDPYPRVWTVHSVETLPDRKQAPARIDSPAFDPLRTVLLTETAPALEACEGGSASMIGLDTHRLSADVDLPCRGMVIFSETWAPGWQATVDGKSASVYEANTFLRGVIVEGGKHRVTLVYRPKSVYIGAALTALGVVLLAFLRRLPLPPLNISGAIRR
jgi:membrane protein YfhO